MKARKQLEESMLDWVLWGKLDTRYIKYHRIGDLWFDNTGETFQHFFKGEEWYDEKGFYKENKKRKTKKV